MYIEQVANLWLALIAASEIGDREARAFLATFAPFASSLVCDHAN
jgi:hypothetical protein